MKITLIDALYQLKYTYNKKKTNNSLKNKHT